MLLLQMCAPRVRFAQRHLQEWRSIKFVVAYAFWYSSNRLQQQPSTSFTLWVRVILGFGGRQRISKLQKHKWEWNCSNMYNAIKSHLVLKIMCYWSGFFLLGIWCFSLGVPEVITCITCISRFTACWRWLQGCGQSFFSSILGGEGERGSNGGGHHVLFAPEWNRLTL